MYWLDWIIVFIPLIVVLWIGVKSQKYVKSVADFLAAGRVAGRYVICVAGGEATMGLISLVALWEMYYKCGFAVGFWNAVSVTLGLFFSLTGYCTYRFRETRAMTMGQFLEMRYNRALRIFAAFLQSISGIMNYAIFPAVGARCMMYFLDLPTNFIVAGWKIPTFGLLMVIFLSIAVWVVTRGGQVTIMVTDCVQGLLSYPFYAILVFYFFYHFSWNDEVIPTLLNRAPGESMINPYDIENLRTFNLFYVLVGIFAQFTGRMTWSGTQGYNAAAANAHEQKMGGLLGTWRGGFSVMMIILLAIAGFTFINHHHFKTGADRVHAQLTQKTVEELAAAPQFDKIRPEIVQLSRTGVASPKLQKILANRPDLKLNQPVEADQYLNISRAALNQVDPKVSKSVGTIYNQMLVPVALREMLPMGITGVLCAVMIFLMISTDTTYMHSWGSIIVQDIILPLRQKPFTPEQQLKLLRYVIAGVAVFAFLFSFFFAQMDYILMFFAITGAIWTAGAGPIIVCGLYWKKGTSWGAFASLIVGMSLSVGGIVGQQLWVSHLYPWLSDCNLVPAVAKFLESVSGPFNPYIVWKVTPDTFPINSQEIFFISLLLSILSYVIFSLLSCRKSFNIEKMLHRGPYSDEPPKTHIPWTWHTLFSKLIGIDSNYTLGDKILAWSVFLWSFGWCFCLCFVVVVVWNLIAPWPAEWWSIQFFITQVMVPGLVAIVSTIWFSIGGTLDLYRLFQRLKSKHEDYSDDGRVIKDDEV